MGREMGLTQYTTRHVRLAIITRSPTQRSGAVERYESNEWTMLHVRDWTWDGYTAWFWLEKKQSWLV